MPLIDQLKSKTVVKDAVRFLIGGGFNTAISYLAYLFFLLFTHYQIAYALSWVVGLLIIVIFYPSKVFVGSQNSWKKTALLIGQYILVFFCGLQCLKALVVYVDVSEQVAALFTMVLTTLLNFLLMRLLYRSTLFR
jgi:putative flippase GtrA